MSRIQVRSCVLVVSSVLLAACGTVSVNSPMIQDRLKLVSAGYTGCKPEDNQLTDVRASFDGSGSWYATCKGRQYLCTSVGSTSGDVSFQCAPVAKD